VQHAEFEASDRPPVKLVRGEKDGWTVNGKEGDRTFVEEVLSNVSDLRASGFPAAQGDYGFSSPRLKVTVHLKSPDGKLSERTLVVGSPVSTEGGGKPAYYAAVEERTEPFIITESDLKLIEPREETLIQTNEPASPLLAPSAAPAGK
jgi:hypothetical protein